ncbi:MAG: Smr/MutS family protein [Desulfovibrio sp.]|nr:Smr/MutS family protein [Desulfovibrio sp.]
MQSETDKALFESAVGSVRPLRGKGRAVPPPPPHRRRPPVPDNTAQTMPVDDTAFTLRHTDEYFEGCVLGLDPAVMARLRSGRYSREKHLDLHGMNARQACDALHAFIRDAYMRSLRCVMVVTGRGRNSPDGVGVLRGLLQDMLCRAPFKRVVLAFCTAEARDGGAGAVYVLLRRQKKHRGKIIWDRLPPDDDYS